MSAAAAPALSLVVQEAGGYTKTGDPLSYRYVVTNLSSVTVHGVSIGDDHVAPADIVCPVATLAPLATEVCTGAFAATAADVTAGSVTNLAFANGLSPAGVPVTSAASGSTVALTPVAALSITASAVTSSFTAAGQQVAYTYVVTNVGTAALHGVGVTADRVAPDDLSCPQPALAQGGSETCAGAAMTTQDDVDAGSLSSTAAATAFDPSGVALTSSGATVTVVGTASSSLGLAVSSPAAGLTAAGDPLTYDYLVTNLGSTTLHGLEVRDDHVPGAAISCPHSTLPPGASQTCSGAYVTAQADLDAGSVTDTATARGSDPEGVRVASSPSGVTVAGTPASAVALTYSAITPRFAAVGDVIAYGYLISNTGVRTLHGVEVVDDHVGSLGVVCPAGGIGPGATVTCTGTSVVTQADLDAGTVTSHAHVTALNPDDVVVASAVAGVTVASGAPAAITLTTTAVSGGFTRAGDVVTYDYLVTDTGSSPVHGIALSDDHVAGAGLQCPHTVLAALDSMTCTGTYSATQADVDAGTITSVSVVRAFDPHGDGVLSSQSVVTVPSNPASRLDISLAATGDGFRSAGQVVALRFVVTNAGATTLRGLWVNARGIASGSIACPQSTLAPRAVMTCTTSLTLGQAAVDAGSITTTAVAAGLNGHGLAVTSPTGRITVQGAPVSSLRLRSSSSPARLLPAGRKIVLAYVVTNSGSTTMREIHIAVAAGHFGRAACPQRPLAPGRSLTCTDAHTVTKAEWASGLLSVAIRAVGRDPHGRSVSSAVTRTTLSRGDR